MESILAIGLGAPELIVIALVILLLFGATKIPQLMRGMGQGVGEFKKGLKDGETAEKTGEKPAEKTEEKKGEAPAEEKKDG
ncbi:MAG: Sec-independent protein translocase subunit TatA/TatB [Planctomycetota bacterium]|jgi:sec-independent protein translocase protein TatA